MSLINQDPENLYQRARGLLFSLDEEEKITLVDVTSRFKESFGKNIEKVTKKFYTEFKKQHTMFLEFVEGIDDALKDGENKNKQWYASLMLNRLMFCYFIQKRGYLDNDLNYLQNKLKEVKQKTGKDKFYTFYREFLLKLFHQGLGQPANARKLTVDLGKIPYLDGGLFDIHELERKFSDINIKDEAFEKIFNFFDQWNWHLDTRVEATGKDINPDVIGYIFEKYINDRADMGAYYTKEDITDYIGKNTIIPFLFDKVKKSYPKAFEKYSFIWTYLKNSSDTYIYDAVKKGIPKDGGLFDDLPDEIKAGFRPELENKIVDDKESHLFEIRKPWNKKAPSEIALPTEIYRELIERRKRYAEIKAKIEKGEITEINDFITFNLNIRQFVQDVIENTNDPDLIRHFYKAIKSITILDPTCGSGAFLFAALNILEPLYETCIQRMEQFTSEEPRKHKFFHEVLAEVNSEEHPNLSYYIYKSIILNNLYGVDIMHEAVEIAKLRLFLKMVGAVDMDSRKPNFGLEPLPDIDFNIRTGNTLVGFASFDELLKSQKGKLDLYQEFDKINEECGIVATAFKRFQDSQMVLDKGEDSHREAKLELQNRLSQLNDKLNEYLASTYAIDKERNQNKYQVWLESHQPFHWFSEFYEIINSNGGFDVIIGNPPYITYPKQSVGYTILNLYTQKSSNLFSFCMERSSLLLGTAGRFSFIVLMASITTKRMKYLRELMVYTYKNNWLINLAGDWHPGRLFDGVRSQFTIWTSSKNCNSESELYTTNYIRWANKERDNLFLNLLYIQNEQRNLEKPLFKYGSNIEKNIFNKIGNKKNSLIIYKNQRPSDTYFYFRNAGIAYYQIAINFKQYFKVNNLSSKSSTLFSFYTNSKNESSIITGLLNSNIFNWFYFCFSDCYHLTSEDFLNFKIDIHLLSINQINDIITNTKSLMCSLKKYSIIKITNYKTKGKIEYQEFYPRYSKNDIDKIDLIFAKHYGFTEEELDFIINYDIKYRMGKELDAYVEGELSDL